MALTSSFLAILFGGSVYSVLYSRVHRSTLFLCHQRA
uniref:Uncharacterized protein n=1 Tax=Arundo donax TaxID=35708 RepID=A0A0A9CS10_ARUDO